MKQVLFRARLIQLACAGGGALFLLRIFQMPATAYEEQRALTNLAHDFVECAAYFSIAAEGVRRVGDNSLAATLQNTAMIAIARSIEITNQEVTDARLRIAIKEQMEATKNDFSNIAILNVRYGELCKKLMVETAVRLKYWLDKK